MSNSGRRVRIARASEGERPARGGHHVIAASPPQWYLVECARGQQLLDDGRTGEAQAVFESALARLDAALRFERAVVLGRLGRCDYLGGHTEAAVRRLQDAIAVAGALPATDGVIRLRGTLRSELGDAHRAAGAHDAAKQEYGAALRISEQSGNLRGQGVDHARLGALALG